MMKLNKKLAIVPGIIVAAGISLTACRSVAQRPAGERADAQPGRRHRDRQPDLRSIVGQSSIVAAQLDGRNVLTGSAPGSRMDN